MVFVRFPKMEMTLVLLHPMPFLRSFFLYDTEDHVFARLDLSFTGWGQGRGEFALGWIKQVANHRQRWNCIINCRRRTTSQCIHCLLIVCRTGPGG